MINVSSSFISIKAIYIKLALLSILLRIDEVKQLRKKGKDFGDFECFCLFVA